MNLDTCTPPQRQSIEHVHAPLLISAGAGSGKTFTLTQRIAYALLPESGPAVGSIDEVLAITFTEKAASEIKARVKRTLRKEGLVEEALKVDGAWISTIHGMCSRILKAHALDLNIDPAFSILGESQRRTLISEAINSVLNDDKGNVFQGPYAALFKEYPVSSFMPNQESITSMLEKMMSASMGLRGGISAIDFGPEPTRASALARELLISYEEVSAVLEQAGSSATARKARANAADTIESLQGFLADKGNEEENETQRLTKLLVVLNEHPKIGGTFKASVKEQVKAHKSTYAWVVQQAALGVAFALSEILTHLAQEVSARYTQSKRALCMLDNDDLLSLTLDTFERFPFIAQRYENRFSLVMVDEFQDTSQMQIEMISLLAGSRCAHLCTVGDAQQSIYRFRGADVNVYEAHKAAMRSSEIDALYIELTKNFRSHADILSFVDRVFEQPSVFGERFMSLAPHDERDSTYKAKTPRLDLFMVMKPSGNNTGLGIDDVKQQEAREIACRFDALRKAGHNPGDMVVLLGKMSRANVYATELRNKGFECVVSGGSQFSSADEVRIVSCLLESLANPHDTKALFAVLTSDMFCLNDDDLLVLATKKDAETDRIYRRSLDSGMRELSGEHQGCSEDLQHALTLFNIAQAELDILSASMVLKNMITRSGWLSRLEGQGASGLACAANILKTLRLIEALETERGLGLATLSRACIEELFGGLRDKPGALSGSGSNVVKIMTIHSSKGLEFPLVALADFENKKPQGGGLLLDNINGSVRASLALVNSLASFPKLKDIVNAKPSGELEESNELEVAQKRLRGNTLDSVTSSYCDQSSYRSVLLQRLIDEELAEARRKLYVGLTRASESLVVSMSATAKSDGSQSNYSPLIDDIRSALCGYGDFPEESSTLTYGGSEPASFERVTLLPCSSEDAQQSTLRTGAIMGSRKTPQACKDARAWKSAKRKSFSYSSIAPSKSSLVKEESLHEVPEKGDEGVATSLGSAFHRAAQWSLEMGKVPDRERLEALGESLNLTCVQMQRLESACAQWFSSDIFQRTLAYADRYAEVPFYTPLGESFLEGEIDALYLSEQSFTGGKAFVVDYKTGGSLCEVSQSIYDKHLLQAQCYAFALLVQGFESVELCFVRVECPCEDGRLQQVTYQFDRSHKEELEETIISQWSSVM